LRGGYDLRGKDQLRVALSMRPILIFYDWERILRRIKLHKLHHGVDLSSIISKSILNILKDSKEDNIDFDIKTLWRVLRS